MTPMKSLGPIVKILREAQGITQLQLALEAGYDSGNMSKFEAGRQGVKEETLNRIAQVLGTTRADLLRKAAEAEENRTAQAVTHDSAESNPGFHSHEPTASPVHTSEKTSSYRVNAVPVLNDAQVVDVIANRMPLSSITFARTVVGLPDGKDSDFAWHVPDETMTAATGGALSFPTGSIAYFDPTLMHSSGDCVLVQIAPGEITFTRVVKVGGSWMMSPLNERYPSRELPFNARVLAVAVGCMTIVKHR